MQTVVDVLREVRGKHPNLNLTDGRSFWRIEGLLRTAERDLAAGDPEAVNPVYYWGYTGDRRVSIIKFDPELGSYSVLTEPKPGLVRRKASEVLPIVVEMQRRNRKRTK